MKATIYHNPRCSKSRETLALLEGTPGVEVEIVEYLKAPPSRATLAALYAKAGMTPRDGLRKGEDGAKALKDAGDDAILDAMAADPILIERPLVETDRACAWVARRRRCAISFEIVCRLRLTVAPKTSVIPANAGIQSRHRMAGP